MGKAKESVGFVKCYHSVFDNSALDTYEFRILYHINRQTTGYDKKSDGISLSQFVKATGIGKDKVISTIKSLKVKRLIKVVAQKTKGGGNSYNRYSLNLVADTDKGSRPDRQGVVADTDTQKKIEQKNEREPPFLEADVKAFIEYLMIQDTIRNPKGYERAIRQKLSRGDKATVKMFRDWKDEQIRAKRLQEFRHSALSKDISITLQDETKVKGRLMSIREKEDYYIVDIEDVKRGNKRVRFESLEDAQKCLVDTG